MHTRNSTNSSMLLSFIS